MENMAETVVAVYVRVSSEEQAEKGYSIDEQKKLLVSYCESNGYRVYDIYTDAGISGKDIVHRPAMQRMLGDAKARKFNLVLSWKISRLSRRLKDAIEIVEFLDRYNIRYKSYSEPFETNTLSGKMQFQMISMIAEFERGTIQQNVKMGQIAKSKKGEWCGGPAMLGYEWEVMPEYRNATGRRKSKLVINPKEAEIVRHIFELYAEGKGYKAIVNQLNREGYTTKRGHAFSVGTVRDILLNPVYIGKVRYNVRVGWNEKRRRNINPDPVIVDGIHERIISDELWNKVQIIYSTRKGRKSRVFSYEYPLTGIMRCPECGAGMVIAGTTNVLKDGTKKRIPYYTCGNFSNKGSSVCHSNSINAIEANKEVFRRVEELCHNERLQEKVIKKAKELTRKNTSEYSNNIRMYSTQIENNKKRKEKLFDAFENELISSEEFLERKKSIDENIRSLTEHKENVMVEMANAKTNDVPEELIKETLASFGEVLHRCEKREMKKELMNLLIKEITLTNERYKKVKDIHVVFNDELVEFLDVKDESQNKSDSSFRFVKKYNLEMII